MLAFSLLAYGWLLKELQSPFSAWVPLERCGAASYSMYLVHHVVLGGLSEHMPPLTPIVDLLIRGSSIVLATFVMYQFIEAPSHRLARQLAHAVLTRRANTSTIEG